MKEEVKGEKMAEVAALFGIKDVLDKRELACRNCGEDIELVQDKGNWKWRPLNKDGTAHVCAAFPSKCKWCGQPIQMKTSHGKWKAFDRDGSLHRPKCEGKKR